MANDLSDLDHASPAAGDLVALGDDAIRETRQKVKNWGARDLGNTNAEHHATGPHRFHSGDGTPPGFAGLPAFGNSGRIAFDTTNGYLLRDDGTTWQLLHACRVWRAFTVGPNSSIGSGSFATIQTLNNVVIPSNALAMFFWSVYMNVSVAPASATQPSFRVQVNGSVASSQPTSAVGAFHPASATSTITHSGVVWWNGAFTVGSNTITLQGVKDAAVTAQVGDILLTAFVF